MPLCIWSSTNKQIIFLNLYVSFFLFLEFAILGAFCSLDLLLFFLFFEIILIPMIFLIGLWGSNLRKLRAMYMFLIYTALGSIFILLAILIIYLEKYTTNFNYLFYNTSPFSEKKQKFLWWLFFLGLAIKIPIFPLHIWLPEAHVEASTEGSIILASLLLKLGGYGFLRTCLPLCPYASIYYLPVIYTFCIFSIIYASFIALRQNDFKKIIAYSSIAHMNIVVLGLFSLNIQGLQGAMFLMVGHGLASSGLFFLVGNLYDRYRTRLITYYGGLFQTMPIFSIFFFIFILTNFSFPGTCNFIGEFLILIGFSNSNLFVTFFIAFSSILTVGYSILLFNKVIFSSIKLNYIKFYIDLQSWELDILFYLTFLTIFFGIKPIYILQLSHSTSLNLLEFFL